MSYTNSNLVRNHLEGTSPVFDKVFDQIVLLTGVESVQFFDGSIASSSVRVKSLQSVRPTPLTVTLSGGKVIVTSLPILRGSVLVASNSSLATIYTENLDYIIDYETGQLSTKAGGGLQSNQSLHILLHTYLQYTAGDDYIVNSDRGEIRRTASGDIASGETVYLDYEPTSGRFLDSIISSAVTEANSMIERELDPQGVFGADLTLQSAATYRALEILCRSYAVRELSRTNGSDRVSRAWVELADQYLSRSEQLMRNFRPPFEAPSSPVKG